MVLACLFVAVRHGEEFSVPLQGASSTEVSCACCKSTYLPATVRRYHVSLDSVPCAAPHNPDCTILHLESAPPDPFGGSAGRLGLRGPPGDRCPVSCVRHSDSVSFVLCFRLHKSGKSCGICVSLSDLLHLA